MIAAILVIGALSAFFGLVLGYSAIRFKVEGNPIVDQIDAILPQTQCGQCGFAGCRPYAEAIASGEADINRCPPGGEAVIQNLADLLGVDPKPLDEERGEHKSQPEVARVIEDYCIGCTKCLQACPVDAIIGAAKQMHVVIAEECTGCELCVPVCPVDCIVMEPVETTIDDWVWPLPEETESAEPVAAH
ncbi:MAG TPA: electron transport complex subunit RsxB [Gammaproteobacteria bacterium]|nr:electron transport complex subunit RsxB [Gammaproteobacteria bacterium]